MQFLLDTVNGIPLAGNDLLKLFGAHYHIAKRLFNNPPALPGTRAASLLLWVLPQGWAGLAARYLVLPTLAEVLAKPAIVLGPLRAMVEVLVQGGAVGTTTLVSIEVSCRLPAHICAI